MYVIAFGIGWMTLYIHLLAVRTGLVIVYISVLALLIIRLYKHFAVKELVIASTLLIGTAMALIKNIPTLQTRLSYMIYDWEMYREDKGTMYSDSDRIQSLKVGWHLFIQNPLIGVGIGDLRHAVNEEYLQKKRKGN